MTDNHDQEALKPKLYWKDAGYGFYKVFIEGHRLTVGWDTTTKQFMVILNGHQFVKKAKTIEQAQIMAESAVLSLAQEIITRLS